MFLSIQGIVPNVRSYPRLDYSEVVKRRCRSSILPHAIGIILLGILKEHPIVFCHIVFALPFADEFIADKVINRTPNSCSHALDNPLLIDAVILPIPSFSEGSDRLFNLLFLRRTLALASFLADAFFKAFFCFGVVTIAFTHVAPPLTRTSCA